MRLREGNRLCQVTQPRAQGSIQRLCFFFLFWKLQVGKDNNNGDCADHIMTHPYSKPSVVSHPITTLQALASYFFPDHTHPSTFHPSPFCSSHRDLIFFQTHLRVTLPQGLCTCCSLCQECLSPVLCLALSLHSSPQSGLPCLPTCRHTLPLPHCSLSSNCSLFFKALVTSTHHLFLKFNFELWLQNSTKFTILAMCKYAVLSC